MGSKVINSSVPKLAVLATQRASEDSAATQTHQVTLTVALDGVTYQPLAGDSMVNELDEPLNDRTADLMRALKDTSGRAGSSLATLTVDNFMEELDQTQFASKYGTSYLANLTPCTSSEGLILHLTSSRSWITSWTDYWRQTTLAIPQDKVLANS